MVHGKFQLQGYKIAMKEVVRGCSQTTLTPTFGGVLGARVTFKKAVMEKTFKNGLSMSETDFLNHKRLDVAI